jgi:hypothetical protein
LGANYNWLKNQISSTNVISTWQKMNGLIFILFYFVLGKVELGRKFLFHACKKRSLSSSFLTWGMCLSQ